MTFKPKLKNSVARSFVLYILLFSSFAALISTSVQLFFEYKRDINAIERTAKQIENSHKSTIIQALWGYDDLILESQLKGINALPGVIYAGIKKDGQVLREIGSGNPAEKVISYKYTLLHQMRAKEFPLGTLEIKISLSDVYNRLWDRVVLILFTQTLKTFFVSVFILYLFYLIVGRHLKSMADFATSINLNTLGEGLVLNRRKGKNKEFDELGVVESALNTMRIKLLDEMENVRFTQKALLKSEERYRLIAEHSSDSIWSMDSNRQFTYLSPSTERLFGYTDNEWETLDWHEFVHPNHIDHVLAVFDRLQTGGRNQSFTVESLVRHKDGQFIWVEFTASSIWRKEGLVGFVGITRDICDRKQAEQALENRILALTRPLDSGDDLRFAEIFTLGEIQLLQDQFAQATGVASIITDVNGEPITEPSNFSDFCQIIRKTEMGRKNCIRSNTLLGTLRTDGPAIQLCLSSGLWEAGAGISVGGKHIANWLIGQVRDDTHTQGAMEEYAREIGVDQGEFIQAFKKIPAMSQNQFESVANALFTLSNQLSTMAYQNIQQARFISEKQLAEKELKEAKVFLETMSDLAYIADDKGNLVWANAAAEKITGLKLSDVAGKPFLPLFVKEDHESLIRVYHRTLEGESKENTLTFNTGITCHFTSSPKYNENGDIIGTFGVARDITALTESEERFKTLHNASFGGIIVHDKGVILECNKGLSEITGYDYDELIGMEGLALVSEDTREDVRRNIDAGYEKPYEAKGLRKNGEIYPLRLEARNIPYQGRQARVVEFRDISENKQAEEEKEKLENQLQQSQKMEAVGRLAGGVAHDFNNMLGVIIGHTEMIKEEVDPRLPIIADLDEILSAAERSVELTRQLLAFARKQTIAPKILNLNDTVSGMTNMLQRVIGEDIHLSWKPGDNLGQVKVDPSQIDQILVNLCVNARDAIADTGAIIIETGNVTFDHDYCSEHTGFVEGKYILLSVSDDGTGMSPETLNNIFEPFFTTKGPGKGTGLGLSTVYGAVKQNKGFINVYSEPGQGTTFKIYFPRYLTPIEVSSVFSAPAPEEKGHETILLVEDEPAILRMAQIMLERLGYRVISANTPGEAIELAHKHAGEIHLLMTDVVMPEMNGRDLAKNILSSYPKLKRLFMSGYTADVIAHHGILDSGINFIQKPFSKGDLSVKIREALQDKE